MNTRNFSKEISILFPFVLGLLRERILIWAALTILVWAAAAGVAAPIRFEELTLVGNAAVSEANLLLTPAKRNRAGAAWFPEKQAVSGGFETTFQFRLTQQGGMGHGADGFAFVIQNAGPRALGGRGSAGGFAVADPTYRRKEAAIPWSVAVFFDTFKNGREKDPSDNYVGLCTYGSQDAQRWPASRLAFTPHLPVYLRDQKTHTVRILFQPPLLSIFMDNLAKPVLTSVVDLSIVTDAQGAAWVGFTASTGWGYQNHEIVSWSFQGTDVSSNISAVSSQITFLTTGCLVDRKLCTPEKAVVERRSTGFHVILPGNLEWGASIANAGGRAVEITNAHGIVCWDVAAQGADGCSGPAGKGGAASAEFLSATAPAGALIMKNQNGQTWFSVNGRKGAGFRTNEGFYEFDVAEK